MRIIETDDICPVIMIKLLKLWNEVQNEEEVILKTPWEAIVEEVKKWCESTGNYFISASRENNKIVVKLKLFKR
ncbi:MAG: sulfurtransferase TusA family protein [Sulfolobaceae archaeon]